MKHREKRRDNPGSGGVLRVLGRRGRALFRRVLAWLRIGRAAEGSHPLGNADDVVHEAAILLRAAEIAREAGQRYEALGFYGRAIDACLRAGLTRKAEALCKHVIEMEPEVIRSRYTLAAIAVARNDVKGARKRLTDYMDAVGSSKAEHMAVPPLLELAGSTANPAMRDLVAGALRRAGRPDLADAVEHGTGATAGRSDWSRAVGAALKGPGDLDPDAPTSG